MRRPAAICRRDPLAWTRVIVAPSSLTASSRVLIPYSWEIKHSLPLGYGTLPTCSPPKEVSAVGRLSSNATLILLRASSVPYTIQYLSWKLRTARALTLDF